MISMWALWDWTFRGSVFIVMVLLVRALLFRQLPKRAFTILWTAATVQLLVPVSALFPALNWWDWGGAGAGLDQAALAVPAAVERAAQVSWLGQQAQHLTNVVLGLHATAFGAVWMAGAAVCALVFLVRHLRGRRVYAMSLPADHPFLRQWLAGCPTRRPVSIRVSDRIGAPLTYGAFRPVVLLPRDMDWEDRKTLAYVLAHEFHHIRSCDVVRRWALAAAACLHWFDPLVWVMYAVAGRDMELACDEAAASCFAWGSPAGYARALVAMEERRSSGSPFASHFSQSTLEARVKALMAARRRGPVRFAAAVLVVAVLAAVCGTSGSAAAVRSTEDDPVSSQAVEWDETDGEPDASEAPLDLTSDDPIVYVEAAPPAGWDPVPEPTVPPSAYVEPAPPADVSGDTVYWRF